MVASVQLEGEISATIDAALTTLPVTFQHLQNATSEDKLLQTVIQHVKTMWPSTAKEIDSTIRPFYARKDALSVVRGCLMLSDRVVVPKEYQLQVLKTLHKGHPGQERMKSLMRSHVYWPGIDRCGKRCTILSRVCISH